MDCSRICRECGGSLILFLNPERLICPREREHGKVDRLSRGANGQRFGWRNKGRAPGTPAAGRAR